MTWHANVTEFGVLPGIENAAGWAAAQKAATEAYEVTGERSYLHLPADAGAFYVQSRKGNGDPYTSGVGLGLRNGVNIVGAASSWIENLPTELGGVPCSVLGVSNPLASVVDVGTRDLEIRNTGSEASNQNHGVFFHSSRAPEAWIERIHNIGLRVNGVADGDGLYLGTRTRHAFTAGLRTDGCRRHGATIASAGAGRYDFVFLDCYMGEVVTGSPFHLESGFQREEAYALLKEDPHTPTEALIDAMDCVRGLMLHRCLFAGHVSLNGVADWELVDCTSRGRPSDGVGGAVTIGNAPMGRVLRSTFSGRSRGGGSSLQTIWLIGGLVSDIEFEDCLFETQIRADGSTPSFAIHSRTYSGAPTSATTPGWPRNIRFVGKPSRFLLPMGTELVNAHQGTGWDLDGAVVFREA